MEQFSNADNQQASLCELSWLGGIVDGEGCITVSRRMGNQTASPIVTIVNTEEKLLDKVQRLLQKCGIAYYVRVHRQSDQVKRVRPPKQKIEFVIAGHKRVPRFLDLIHPYLISKQPQAQLLMQFCAARKDRAHQPFLSTDKSMCSKLWGLNGRGTKW